MSSVTPHSSLPDFMLHDDSDSEPRDFFAVDDDDDESGHSISLSSATPSPPPLPSSPLPKTPTSRSLGHFQHVPRGEDAEPEEQAITHEPESYLVDSPLHTAISPSFDEAHKTRSSSFTSVSPSIAGDSSSPSKGLNGEHDTHSAPTYPPPRSEYDVQSVASFASSSSKKARPESALIDPPKGQLVLGIALVGFNHQSGPEIEFCEGELFDDPEISHLLPFLALPDGAHLSSEDLSYFHVVPSSPNPTTIFGISCNRQIDTRNIINPDADMTRSTVQKAVVILAAKPLFGPIRDKLGVVTQAYFNQRDFHVTDILVDFYRSLEPSLRNQLTESALYMGTNLRELVHKFRHRTLLLVKSLMLQRRIMFFGHPVERLCTYQYSLASLIPGLLQTLDDSGSPPLMSRAPTLKRPTSLKTSDRKSMLAYTGQPLDIFGKDSFFQPYLPLQQMSLLAETRSWLCGTTNHIVTQQKEIDLLVNIEQNTFEFRHPKLEKLVSLTAADRKWMDEIVKDVNETWNDADPSRPTGMQFKGSEDYLRTKFEEYVTAALSSVKYADFLAKGQQNGVLISDGDAGAHALQDFNLPWVAEFRRTHAFEVWDRVTDPTLFDIVEPKHPCPQKPSAVGDIGLRLQEGLLELKLDQQLAPTKEVLSNAFNVGSTNILKAVEGVRERWAAQRSTTVSPGVSPPPTASSRSSTPVEITKADADIGKSWAWGAPTPKPAEPSTLRPLSLVASQAAVETRAALGSAAVDAKAALGSWGTGLGNFLTARAPRFSLSRSPSATPVPEMPEPQAPTTQPQPRSPTVHSSTSADKKRSLSMRQALALDNNEHDEEVGSAH